MELHLFQFRLRMQTVYLQNLKLPDDNNFVLQSVNGAKRNQDSLSSEFKAENDELRREFQYIRSSKKLWYLKRTALNHPEVMNLNSMLIIMAAMHRVSEIVRYKPEQMAHLLNSKENWLLHEFLTLALDQFIDELAAEITGQDINVYRSKVGDTMAELNLKQITDKLNSEFASDVRKLVFWYDANAEFQEDIDSIELENAKVLHLEPDNQFYIKYFLEREDTTTNYLVYAPFAKPNIRDNHLADTIRYSKEFFADRASLLTLDLGIDERYKPVIQHYIKFFANKTVERCVMIWK